MLQQIAIYSIFGLPFFALVGIAAILSFLFTAYVGAGNLRGFTHIPLKWHFRMAKISIGLALIHAILAISLRF